MVPKIFLGIFSIVLSFTVVIVPSKSSAQSAPFAIGGAAGVEFPFAHGRDYDPGIAVEAFFRKDPYELRFHFADTKTQSYSVLLGIKHFLSNTSVRPYVEAAAGPTIVDSKGRGLGYGLRPEATLGADLGLSRHLSFGAAARYFGMIYFGDTNSGNMEAQHGLDLLFNVVVWF